MTLTLQDERATLTEVRDQLANGDLTTEYRDGRRFAMEIACLHFECGTAACIGGHAWLVENKGDRKGAADYVYQFGESQPLGDTPLARLFYPQPQILYGSTVSEARAVQAIDNYLNTGDPQWERVMEGA